MRLDPDDLAAAAVDGNDDLPLTEVEDRETMDAFRRIVSVGRTLSDDDRATDDPPAELWDRIAAAVREDRPEITSTEPTGAPVTTGLPSGEGGTDNVVSLDSRRHATRILAAAAAVVVLLVGVTVVAVNRTGGSGTELVASADLAVVDGDGSGNAELVRREDGLHLIVDVSDLTPAERADFFELWLLTPDGTDPQSIDKFTEANGVVDAIVPEGVDTAEFPVVDISEEIDDGDTTHSGKSILRGTLQ